MRMDGCSAKWGRQAICIRILAWLVGVAGAEAAEVPVQTKGAKHMGRQRRAKLEQDYCMRRVASTDFAINFFNNPWMARENMTAYFECLYKLRTSLKPAEKVVYAGGVHYPTLIVANHQHPVVSTSATRWCWLHKGGLSSNGLSHNVCCDTQYGPRGLDTCWDSYFTYDLCCLGDLAHGEAPHFYSAPALDINVGNTLKMRGTFDLRMSYALQALCRRGDTVLDVGANIGAFTVPLAERVGPSGEVHAFEPFRKVFQHLNANVALNGLSNVYTYNYAIGRQEKTLEIHTPDLNTFNFPSAMRVEDQHVPGAHSEANNVFYEQRRGTITMRTLDSFSFGPKIDLIKIDVEFMELEVVLGARETIRRYQPVIWAENEPFFTKKPPDTTFVDTMLSEFGYTCQSVSHLELLCTPTSITNTVIEGVNKMFKVLNRPLAHLKLQDLLAEVDPNYARTV